MKDTKEHILRISFGLFLQKSFKEVTMKEIVEKTGLSKGAFYHYFDSKEQIFIEIIHYAFDSLLNIDFAKLNRDSLFAFYHDYISYMNKTYASFINELKDGSSFDLNYYSLIFDAVRMFPDFKEKMIASNNTELESWIHTIQTAKATGEISSSMEDRQIANVFIHTNSGIGMNNIMTGNSESTTKDLLAIWDSFYVQLKQ